MLSDRSPNTFARSNSLVKHLMLTAAVIIALVLSPVAVRASDEELLNRATELQQKVNRLQGQIRDMKLDVDPMKAQAEVDKERIRAQGREWKAALQRSSRRDLENALLECRREVNGMCDEVNNARCAEECQSNDKMHNLQQTCDFLERELAQPQNPRATAEYQQEVLNLQAQIEDTQLDIDQANNHAEEENLRIRARGNEEEATLQRISESDLANALELCGRETHAACYRVDDTLFMDECLLNDRIREVQNNCDAFEGQLAQLQRVLEDLQCS